jgi:hypothetical protein
MAKEESLKSYLATLTGVGVYSDAKPQDVANCIVFRRISTKRYRSMSGTIPSLERVRFQIDIFNSTKKGAREMAELIKDSLDGNHTSFKTAVLLNDLDIPEIEVGIHHSSLDFYIW